MYWSVLLSIVDRVLTLRILAAGPALILLLIALRTGGPMGSPMEGLSMEMMWLIVLVIHHLSDRRPTVLNPRRIMGGHVNRPSAERNRCKPPMMLSFGRRRPLHLSMGPVRRGSVPRSPPLSSKTTTRSARIERWRCIFSIRARTNQRLGMPRCPIPPSEPVPWIGSSMPSSRGSDRGPHGGPCCGSSIEKDAIRATPCLVPPAGGLMMTPMERPESSLAFEIHSMSDEGWIDISMDGRGQVKD